MTHPATGVSLVGTLVILGTRELGVVKTTDPHKYGIRVSDYLLA